MWPWLCRVKRKKKYHHSVCSFSSTETVTFCQVPAMFEHLPLIFVYLESPDSTEGGKDYWRTLPGGTCHCRETLDWSCSPTAPPAWCLEQALMENSSVAFPYVFPHVSFWLDSTFLMHPSRLPVSDSVFVVIFLVFCPGIKGKTASWQRDTTVSPTAD